jgi:hypothetical protein
MKKTLIIIMILLYGCTEDTIYKINPSKFRKKNVLLSEIAESIDYIPLESRFFVQHIMKIICADSFLVVANYPEGLHLYSKKGDFLNKIGKRGNGPGEYQYGTSFTIDNKNKLIYILDRNNNIFKYDFYNNFLDALPIDHLHGYFRDIEFYNGHLFLFETINNGFAKYKWVEIDTTGNTISIQPNSIPTFECNIGFRSDCSYKTENSLVYWDKYNDTIFQIKDENINVRYLWDKWKTRLPRENITPAQYENFYFDPWNIIESKDFLFIYYYENKHYCTAFLNKEKEQFYIVNKSKDEDDRYCGPGFTNDIDGGLNFAPMENYVSPEGEYLIGWEFAYKLKNHVNHESFIHAKPKFPEKKKELEKLANSLNENDNPVLMLVKLKEKND